ncbi:solute carrier family 23 protein [Caldalkalibacillus mannanilyticus]|uniref:solute carrier family 23 protein n=1 Tax=Caldalkalibacillus mannanilyticus TaxID=1418 RepID=UPI0004684AC0|nr:solute carrier family 23 protein [Caldalkalibacillus mannanilyticus]
MDQKKMVLDVHERPTLAQWLPLSLQHLFAMFGATILVPFLVGISPAVALVASGVGTLAFLVVTRGMVPAYLGSSFAFIAPLATVVGTEGVGQAMFGALFAGILYGVISLLIVRFGVGWLKTIFPPIVIGPVIMVIGLGLASISLDMAVVTKLEDGTAIFDQTKLLIASITLIITIVSAIFFRGFFGLIPILIGIIGGYITAFFIGEISFNLVREASMFAIPEFVTPVVSWTAVAIIMPVALVTLVEHTGDMMVISKVMDRNLLQRPGLHRTLLGDGIATTLAAFMGGPPNTTYGENVGVLALSRVFSVYVVGGAAVLAIFFGFSGKINAFITTIPVAVMGGVTILLFGLIASSGLRVLIDSEVNLTHKRNLIIASVILVSGIGTTILNQQQVVSFSGMATATILGIVLHLFLPEKDVSYGQKPMFTDDLVGAPTK